MTGLARALKEKYFHRRTPERASARDLGAIPQSSDLRKRGRLQGIRMPIEKRTRPTGARGQQEAHTVNLGFASWDSLRYKRRKKTTMILTSGQKAARTRRRRAADSYRRSLGKAKSQLRKVIAV